MTVFLCILAFIAVVAADSNAKSPRFFPWLGFAVICLAGAVALNV